ncbi:MAG: PIN domain-containing protein [Phycisphaerales bacterium]|jgi:predicted nucleic acid-binding protein|nr:PIN domain-containing protein [Phycisphaerales bacterium]
MNRIFLDINVILDIFAQRDPHYAASAEIYSQIEHGELTGLFSVLSLGTTHYILQGHASPKKALRAIQILRSVVELVDAPTSVANLAIDSGWGDFEDALQYYSAVHGRANCIVTRNPRDFSKSEIPIFTPEEFLALQEES